MQSVTGALLIINVCMLNTVDLGANSNVTVLITKIHVNYNSINKQLNIVSTLKKLSNSEQKRKSSVIDFLGT